jgi:hypothetical protein
MREACRYRGRTITAAHVAAIRTLLATYPGDSRWAISRRLCEAWNWRQPNGALCDQTCRGLLLILERAGWIQLPALRRRPHNPLAERQAPEPVIPDNRPVTGLLSSLPRIEMAAVRRSPEEPLFHSWMEQYHYWG